MSAAAARSNADVVSLDDYRRMRAGRDGSAPPANAPVARAPLYPMAQQVPMTAVPGPMWVYWVPVWIW